MWKCRLCHVSFAFESVEQHVYNNHLKRNVWSIRVYNCGECMFTGEGFEDIALHCINLGHEPTRVNKGLDFDDYASQLFTALQEIMCLNKPSASDMFSSTFLTSPSEQATPIINGAAAANINWTTIEPTGEFDYECNNVNQPLVDDTSEPGTDKEGGYMDEVNKTEPSGSEDVQVPKTPMTKSNPKPMAELMTNSSVSGSESETATKRSRPEGTLNNTPSLIAVAPRRPPPSPVVSGDGKKTLYPCATCPKTFVTSSVAKVHERVHTGEKPFQCQTCGMSCSQRSSLTTHARIHSGEKPFPCSACGKSFVRSDMLKAHERSHTGDKPYTCSVCGKAYTQSGRLTVHKRTHRGEKPYTCPVCRRSFARKDTLDSHRRTHTGEKPFPCSVCGKGFTQSSRRYIHQRACVSYQ